MTIDQFGKALVASGLMTADDVKATWNAIPPESRPKDGAGFGKLLVEKSLLTPFQAAEILAGRGARLMMGDYTIVSQIGAGGMGQVYKAQHRRMKRVVALKVMSNAAMQDEAAVKRFQREVHAAARLEHPNIVTAYDSGEAGSVKYLVMQFVDGGDLSDLVKKTGWLEIAQAVGYVIQAAKGLAFAHGEGVIHRDIKPANLLLDKKGIVKILDMGLARFEDGGDGLTATEQVMGTVDYMSPEQAANTKGCDGRADIYSLGCTLWYLLTGKKLYEADTLIARLMLHRDGPLPSLVKERDDAPWPLEQALHKMIAKRAADRYQTMDEVVAALAPFGGDASSVGSSSGTGTSGGPSADLASFMQAMGTGGTKTSHPSATQMKAPAAKPATSANLEATAQLSTADVGTDPKSQVLPKAATTTQAQPQAKGSGKKPPPNKNLLLAGAGGGALLVLLGAWFIFRDKDGNEVARVQMPEGGSVSVQQAADAARPTPVAMPTASAFSLPASNTPGSMFGLPTSEKLPPAEIVAPAADGFVYLDDLKSFGWTGKAEQLHLRGRGYGGEPFKWNGAQPSHSLFTHAADFDTSRLSYPLDARYESFAAEIGVLSNVMASPLTFRVVGDGRELWKSRPIKNKNDTNSFSVSVRGVGELRLEVDCPGSSQHGHAVWIAPRLTPGRSTTPTTIRSTPWPFDPPDGKQYAWSAPENLGPAINTKGRNLLLGISDDELTIYLGGENLRTARRASRQEPFGPPGPIPGITDRCKGVISGNGLAAALAEFRTAERAPVWLSARSSVDQPFSPPVKAEPPASDSNNGEGRALSPNGLTLAVNSNRNRGSADIWIFRRPALDQPFGSAERLAEPVSTPDWDIPYFISNDRCFLIAASQRGTGGSAERIVRYFRRAAENEPFGPGTEIELPLGSAKRSDSNGDFRLADDGRALYFSSYAVNGGHGDFDVWVCRRVSASGRPLVPSKPEDLRRLLDAKFEVVVRTPSPFGAEAIDSKLKSGDALPNGPATIVGLALGGSATPIDDALLGFVAGLTELEELRFEKGTHSFSAQGLRKLASLTQLRRLSLYNVGRHADGASDLLASLPHLEFLHIPYGTQIAGEWAAAAAVRPSIIEINAFRADFSDTGISPLEKMPQLQRLNLSDNAKLTQGAIDRLVAALPSCRIEYGSHSDKKIIEPRSSPAKAAAPPPGTPAVGQNAPAPAAIGVPLRRPLAPSKPEDVRWLLDEMQANVTLRIDTGPDVRRKATEPLPAGPMTIVGIDTHRDGGPQMTDAALARLATLTDLESLRCDFGVPGAAATKAGMSEIAKLTELRYLHLGRMGTQDTDYSFLERLPHLERLGLAYVPIPDWGAHVRRLTSLRELTLHHMDLARIAELKNCRGLQTVILSGDIDKSRQAIRAQAPLSPWIRFELRFSGGPPPEVTMPTAPPPPAPPPGAPAAM